MKRVAVLYGQSIVDIAIQEYGSAMGIVALMQDNPALVTSLNYDLIPGTVLLIKSAVIDSRIQKYYSDHFIQPATWVQPPAAPVDEFFLLTEDGQVITNENNNPLQIEQSHLLTEDGDDIDTELNQPIEIN